MRDVTGYLGTYAREALKEASERGRRHETYGEV
jgi:hypothetical protein